MSDAIVRDPVDPDRVIINLAGAVRVEQPAVYVANRDGERVVVLSLAGQRGRDGGQVTELATFEPATAAAMVAAVIHAARRCGPEYLEAFVAMVDRRSAVLAERDWRRGEPA